MSKQVTIQPNFEISSLLKLKQRDTSLDNFQLYKSGRYALFFGLKNPLLALIIIFILWVLIERTIFWFRLVDKKSSFMLYPYLAWVSFATILNFSIVYLN